MAPEQARAPQKNSLGIVLCAGEIADIFYRRYLILRFELFAPPLRT
jgi:hypothetical protein